MFTSGLNLPIATRKPVLSFRFWVEAEERAARSRPAAE